MVLKIIGISALTLCLTTNSFGAGFDCSKAVSDREIAVCADENLSNLDSQLNDAYKNNLKNTDDIANLKQSQKDWLAETDKCGSDATCLSQAYETRLDDLNGLNFQLQNPIDLIPSPATFSENTRGLFTDNPDLEFKIAIYIMVSGLLALITVRPPMMRWYRSQMFIISGKGADDVFNGRILNGRKTSVQPQPQAGVTPPNTGEAGNCGAWLQSRVRCNPLVIMM